MAEVAGGVAVAQHILLAHHLHRRTQPEKVVCLNLTCLFGRPIIRVYPKLLSAATEAQITVTTTEDRAEARARVDGAVWQAGLMQVSCGHWPLAFSNRSFLWY